MSRKNNFLACTFPTEESDLPFPKILESAREQSIYNILSDQAKGRFDAVAAGWTFGTLHSGPIVAFRDRTEKHQDVEIVPMISQLIVLAKSQGTVLWLLTFFFVPSFSPFPFLLIPTSVAPVLLTVFPFACIVPIEWKQLSWNLDGAQF